MAEVAERLLPAHPLKASGRCRELNLTRPYASSIAGFRAGRVATGRCDYRCLEQSVPLPAQRRAHPRSPNPSRWSRDGTPSQGCDQDRNSSRQGGREAGAQVRRRASPARCEPLAVIGCHRATPRTPANNSELEWTSADDRANGFEDRVGRGSRRCMPAQQQACRGEALRTEIADQSPCPGPLCRGGGNASPSRSWSGRGFVAGARCRPPAAGTRWRRCA